MTVEPDPVVVKVVNGPTLTPLCGSGGDTAVHWWPAGAVRGDLCGCGRRIFGWVEPPEDTRPLATPRQWHERSHTGYSRREDPLPFEECWRCGKARVRCREKTARGGRYTTMEEAVAAARLANQQLQYLRPLVSYRCRWCGGRHLTTARKTHQRQRVTKQYRRWAAAQERVRRSGAADVGGG